MRLIVGLGNPGRDYEGTRHNVGFELIDKLSQKLGSSPFSSRLDGLVSEWGTGESKVFLVKPQTFMNLSGRCVSKFVHFYKIPVNSLLVVCDDKDLPLGKLRIRGSGTHGGNNGLRSVQDHIGVEYPRLKIGIGQPQSGDATSHVLGRFTGLENSAMRDSMERAASAVETWLNDGLESCMNKFNFHPESKRE
jgi:PTH1 family peptidyl-tRNA hydrolase